MIDLKKLPNGELTHIDEDGNPLCEVCDSKLHPYEYEWNDLCDECEYGAEDR